MTEGETLFYLREIHSHWTASNVSADKLAELATARLIEINIMPVPTVRLTSEGARCKTLGRPRGTTAGISLNRRPKDFARRAPKKNVTRARPLV